MPKVIPKNIADEMTRPYIDDAVDKQLKAADVPPRNKLDISFKDAGRTDDNKDYDSNQDAYEENHGKLYEMTHNNTIPWKNYVVYIVLLSLLTCVFTFSKYMSGASGISTVAVAKFNIETVGSLNDKDYTIDVGTEGNLTFETGDPAKKIFIKVTSNSEVASKITVDQINDSFTGSFVDNKNTDEFIAGDNQTKIFVYELNPPDITGKTPTGKTTDGFDYYDWGKLEFNVVVEQKE